MFRSARTASRMSIAIAGTLLLVGCGDDEMGPDMVTIAGEVRNVDTGEFAVGVRVTLFETEYQDDTPTGSDGKFVIQVPRGTHVILHTDDFDAANTDVWFPFINTDYPGFVVNENVDNWLIHACPQEVPTGLGSVPVWDNFLQNWDDANGDGFVPASAAASGGIIAMQILGWDAGDFASSASMTISIDDPACPEGYVDASKFYNSTPLPDPSLGPDIMYPPTRTETDDTAVFFSFCDAAVAGDEVTLTIVDNDGSRGLEWVSPFTAPIRPGTITIVIPCHINGAANIQVSDFTLAVGLR